MPGRELRSWRGDRRPQGTELPLLQSWREIDSELLPAPRTPAFIPVETLSAALQADTVSFLRAPRPTMSLEPPTYLSSLQSNIRARPIPWEGAVRAGNITDDHLKKIKAVDKVRKEQRRQTVEGDLKGYATLLAGGPDGKSVLEAASRRTDIVQYILVLAADLLNGADAHPLVSARVTSLFWSLLTSLLRCRCPIARLHAARAA